MHCTPLGSLQWWVGHHQLRACWDVGLSGIREGLHFADLWKGGEKVSPAYPVHLEHSAHNIHLTFAPLQSRASLCLVLEEGWKVTWFNQPVLDAGGCRIRGF